MKYAMARFSSTPGLRVLLALVGAVSCGYYGHRLTQQWQLQLMRRQELTQQTAVYQQVLQEQHRLTQAVTQLQADLATLWQQYQLEPQTALNETRYVAALLAAAETSKLRVLNYDPVTHELKFSGSFAQLLTFLSQTQTLASPFYGVKLLIQKAPATLHITYRYAMHTLAG